MEGLVATSDRQRVVQDVDTQLMKVSPASIDSGASGSGPSDDEVSTARTRAAE